MFHPGKPHIGDPVFEHISDLAFRNTAAGIDLTGGKDGDVAVPTVAAAVDHAFLGIIRYPECPSLVFIKRPEVIFFVKVCLAAFRFIFLKLLVTHLKKLPVFQCGHGSVQFSAAWNIAGEGKDIRACLYDLIDNPRNLHAVLL